MGFLFPLFLLAGLSLAIPVMIHLFNLRRYKRIDFPDTRFLRNIQLSTKRQSKIRNWRLLLLRMLFLAAVILAFAQPYFGALKNDKSKDITAIYIDNSYSMTIGNGQENLLQLAKHKARQLIESSVENARFVLISNNKKSAMRPMLKNEALQALQEIRPTAQLFSLSQLMNSLNAAESNEKNENWNLYCFTDLQKKTFLDNVAKVSLPELKAVYFYPLAANKPSNLYIDTAYFLSPNIDNRQPNPLVVKVRQSGVNNNKSSNLQISIGNQVRAVSNIETGERQEWTDTLALQLSSGGWQDITLSLQDHPVSFDDTFRIAARTAPEMSVLVVTENGINPFLQTALRTYEGFKVKEENASGIQKDDWQQYGLIILQNIGSIPAGLQTAVAAALQRGQNVLMFPGAINNVESFNQSLKAWGDIALEKIDTAQQQVVSMQEAHPLLQDLFEKIPDNVQLPTTVERYPIDASLTANQQSLMTFRDGKPFLAQYSLGQGKMYICASPLDDRSSNFAVSYFFVPILYKMAIQSGSGNMFALNIGSMQPLWLPVEGSDDRKVWHLSQNSFDAIPSQRPSGIGVELFINKAVNEAGFYRLHSEASKDTVHIGVNAMRTESVLEYASKSDVETALKPNRILWIDDRSIAKNGWNEAKAPFPFWKICVMLGLFCLSAETYMLLRKKKISNEDAALQSA
ncbi:hypothetical protein F0919_02470 [Taibaiella lutea]|uniref:Aerotolerance regulator N-terminal domain-containing protein n=1 Tax=Taibaiella lutea TaxID=2608001 RepID=A0A5M6CRI0_9BACT|nr:BatA domain-containing protein [Taibaiella lutea]KAA5536552.1 hypothetical protein F0919_02470 [Taibaiella lutea]